MTTIAHRTRPDDPHLRDAQRAVDAARRDGVHRFQVVALVRPSTAREFVLLIDHRDETWAVPTAEVHPTDTVPRALDWLCDRHLGLAEWQASYAGAARYRTSGDTEVLQVAFDVVVPSDGALSWPGSCQWWHPHADPPEVHRLSRPTVERLQAAAGPRP
ncbi:hypothetical protein DN069_03370 [Streptacidiphilus pinicola]|uniref:NUDIX hydrolase n=1 Tax=Streptacidiphilus pinicola TaxID=2219663 RepID=A0A2X0IP59_9ACTN|nr:hypothetical protein [Streptacidiphilus pinicola]RAG87012.1 hypothetical protein DN069_03370 [Streptacidiphilus pinicola]